MRTVLETPRRHTLYAKASRCQFGRSSVGFLGRVLSVTEWTAVAEWTAPTSRADARRFVGLASNFSGSNDLFKKKNSDLFKKNSDLFKKKNSSASPNTAANSPHASQPSPPR